MPMYLEVSPPPERVSEVSSALKTLGELKWIDRERGGKVTLTYTTQDLGRFREAVIAQGLTLKERD